ncbi:MAG: hypothetical protein M3Y87_09815 [Myxococcota bacterium]|nr:hypothetical protein [Myxococcota bacterium]
MCRLVASLSFLAIVTTAAPSAAQSTAPRATTTTSHPIDGIVAIVGGHTPSPTTQVVLRSDVELRAHLAIAARAPDAPRTDLPPELLAAMLQEILGELLIAREAERLHASEPSATQIARQRAQLVSSLGGEERFARFLRAHDVDASEIDAIAHRRAFVDDFLRANLEGSTLVSDAQVEEVYASGEHPFSDRTLEEVREPLRAWLGNVALQRDVRRWIEVLRGRTPVRVVVPFAPPEPGPAGREGSEEDGADVSSGG